MNVIDCIQRDSTWFKCRSGCVTASRVADALWTLKSGGDSSARRDYKYELIAEMLTGKAIDHYVSPDMQFGIENEPLARTAYEMATGLDVWQVGLVMHPHISRACASPDGVISNEGFCELKVPKITTHLSYLAADKIPEYYEQQMFWQLSCAGPEIKWNDFCSHNPALPAPYDTFIKRLARDEKRIAEMEAQVLQFLKEVDELLERFKEAFGGESITERKLRQSIAIAKGGRPTLVELARELVP